MIFNVSTDLLSLASPAKINLSLRVGNRLSNGLHQIVTTIAPIDLCDKVHLRILEGSQSICRVSLEPELLESLPNKNADSLICLLSSVEHNIAARAAKAVLGDKSFELFIEKKTPTEAGLGGGSGNAATALILANQLLDNKFTSLELLPIAQSIGSDVGPMLFRTPVVQSVPSVLPSVLPVEVAKMELLLVKPPLGTSTKEAYLALGSGEVEPEDGEFLPTFAIENDFEEVFFLEDWFQAGTGCLLELGAERVLLCGSGSCLVGFFPTGSVSSNTILEAKNRLKKWWVYQTRFWS